MESLNNQPRILLSATALVGERNGLRLWGPLNLTLLSGQVLHLRGPNGCGKTTLLRTLAGLRPALAGRIDFGGAMCSFLGHQDGWSEELKAAINLELFARLHAADVRLVPSLMEQLGVPNRAVRHLSAGQRRKLALARLRLKPGRILFLDEPFDALDTHGCQWLTDLAHEHLQNGGAMVLTSHQALPENFPQHSVMDLKQANAGVKGRV